MVRITKHYLRKLLSGSHRLRVAVTTIDSWAAAIRKCNMAARAHKSENRIARKRSHRE